MSSVINMKILSEILHGKSCSHHCRSPAINLPYTQTQKVNVKEFITCDPRLGLAWAALFYLWVPPDKWYMGLVWGLGQYLKMLPLWTFLCLEHWKLWTHHENTLLSRRSFLTWAKQENVSRMWVPDFYILLGYSTNKPSFLQCLITWVSFHIKPLKISFGVLICHLLNNPKLYK